MYVYQKCNNGEYTKWEHIFRKMKNQIKPSPLIKKIIVDPLE